LRNARVAAFALSSSTRYENEKPGISGVVAFQAFDSRRVDFSRRRTLILASRRRSYYKKFSASVKRRRFFFPFRRRRRAFVESSTADYNGSTQTPYFNAFSIQAAFCRKNFKKMKKKTKRRAFCVDAGAPLR
jgi:hypothetical protein